MGIHRGSHGVFVCFHASPIFQKTEHESNPLSTFSSHAFAMYSPHSSLPNPQTLITYMYVGNQQMSSTPKTRGPSFCHSSFSPYDVCAAKTSRLFPFLPTVAHAADGVLRSFWGLWLFPRAYLACSPAAAGCQTCQYESYSLLSVCLEALWPLSPASHSNLEGHCLQSAQFKRGGISTHSTRVHPNSPGFTPRGGPSPQ